MESVEDVSVDDLIEHCSSLLALPTAAVAHLHNPSRANASAAVIESQLKVSRRQLRRQLNSHAPDAAVAPEELDPGHDEPTPGAAVCLLPAGLSVISAGVGAAHCCFLKVGAKTCVCGR